MISAQPLFIPLYFDETEADLWLALQRVEPEKRSALIKETLRQALLETNLEEGLRLPQDKVSEVSPEIQDACNYLQSETQVEEVLETIDTETETFSLDDLFTQTDARQVDGEPVLVPESEKVQSIGGFEYMMKYIIGTEDDENVLKVLNQSSAVGRRGAK
ncbi:MAG TPA: hypothetical protein DEF42_05815 [Desulfosporosinus sp.]|nr:hypothetical protein [Desulfosporosinus sp.]